MSDLRLGRTLFAGLAGGAAGTAALNAVTYLDMVIRGRPASRTPEDAVEKLAARNGVEIPGNGATRENRVTGLGAVLGITTGVAIGVAVAAARSFGIRLNPAVAAIAAGAIAMAASDTPLAALGVTDPRTWKTSDWLSDVIPHLAFGLVTTMVVRRLDRD